MIGFCRAGRKSQREWVQPERGRRVFFGREHVWAPISARTPWVTLNQSPSLCSLGSSSVKQTAWRGLGEHMEGSGDTRLLQVPLGGLGREVQEQPTELPDQTPPAPKVSLSA